MSNHLPTIDFGRKPYITTYESISGYKAVMVWRNPDMGGFWEPYETGYGYYPTRDEAAMEAKQWAENEGLEYKERGYG